MSSTVAILEALSTIFSATLVSMQVMQDIFEQLRAMQAENRNPTEEEWELLEARADQVSQRLADAIRQARKEAEG